MNLSEKYRLSANELLELASISGGKFAVTNLEEAYAFCSGITRSHYENFPVASILLPKKNRRYIYPVYAFARIADDIADEKGLSIEERLNGLEAIDQNFASGEVTSNPIFLALRDTMKTKSIPASTLSNLLTAFRSDINFVQPKNYVEIENYCRYSANPIGELVLRVFGLYDSTTSPLSDSICTGLQMANFWQDLSRDLPNGRCYIPEELLNKYNLYKDYLQDVEKSAKLMFCLDEIYNATEEYLRKGIGLLKFLKPFRLRFEIALTIEGGLKILEHCRKSGAEIVISRPKIVAKNLPWLLCRSLARSL